MKHSHLLPALALTVSLAAVPGATARAQAITQAQPAPALDSARAGVRDAALRLRDSLTEVQAAGAHLSRDFRSTSSAALISRARIMHQACAAAARSLPAARAVFVAGPADAEFSDTARVRMLAAMDQLHGALTACRTQFGAWTDAGDGEAVRDYGNRRAGEIRASIRAYDNRLNAYLGSLGIELRPRGNPDAARS